MNARIRVRRRLKRRQRSIADVRDSQSWPIYRAYVAAQRLPASDTDALAWLHAEGLVHVWRGREVCSWREVVEAIEACPTTLDQAVETVEEAEHAVRTPAMRLARVNV